MEPIHETSMDSNELSEYQQKLINAFEEEDIDLENRYKEAMPKVASLFDSWFGTGK